MTEEKNKAAEQPNDKLSESQRLDNLNLFFDDFDNLQELPETEDEMVLHHMMSTVAKHDGDLDEFYKDESKKTLGFFINDNGDYQIEGVAPEAPTGNNLADYLNNNLIKNAGKAGFEEIGKEDMGAAKIAAQVVDAAQIAKGNYLFLLQNYDSFEDLKTDLEKVITLRQFAEINRDYAKDKETILTRTKLKAETLSFEARVDIVRRNASNPTEAALLWYAIGNFENLAFDQENKLNVYSIFDKDNIETNGVAIVNGRLVVPYKPKKRKLPEGVEYEYATYGFAEADLNPALAVLKDKNNEYEDAKIADMLEDGADIYLRIETNTSETLKSYESNEKFQENYELLQRIMLAPDRMLVSASDIALEGIEHRPDFTNEGGPWYFGRADGKFYARDIHPVEKGECYVFEMSQGWGKVDKMPEVEYAMPELYKYEKDDWVLNDKAIEMTYSLGLQPKEVLTRTLNVLHNANRRNPTKLKKLLYKFAYEPPLGMAIPFPKMDKVEIILNEANWANSVTNVQDILLRDYVQLFPGMDHDAVRWMTKEIAEQWLTSMVQNGKDQNGKPINHENKYLISSAEPVENFIDALNPQHTNILFTAEKQFSEETKARIDQIRAYIENMYAGFFGKLTSALGAKFGVVGETLAQLAEEYARQPLGDVWKLSEELSVEWENVETEKGKTLSFKEFMIIYGVQAIGKLKDPSKIEEGSFLDRLSKWLGKKSEQATPQAPTSQAQVERSPLNVTDDAQLMIFKGKLDNFKYSFGDKRGQKIFTDNEIATMVVEVGNTRDTGFTNEEQKNYVLSKMKAKLGSLSGDNKTTLQAEYNLLKTGTVPAEYAAAAGMEASATAGTAGKAPTEKPEVESGQPGDLPKNPIAFDSIEQNRTYRGWHEASKTITLRNGKLNIDDIKFEKYDSDEKNWEINSSAKIEIEYERENNSDIGDKKVDTFDHYQFQAMQDLLQANNNQLTIGARSRRVNRENGNSTYIDDTIKEIRIYSGVKVKNTRLNIK